MTEAATPTLAFEDVRISYFIRAGEANVIPRLSFEVMPGEAYGLVGESGCGKSTVALAVMRYLGRAGRITGGRILFEGRDLAAATESELRRIRGRRIAMVYQDPMSSLNPVMTVGRQLMEVPLLHSGTSREEARRRALEILEEVNLADPERVMERYPHQLSGGQQQRIVIAMALIAEPSLLIMDEPTTGLDVTVEAAVLDLVRRLRQRHRSAILFISHNLGAVAQICDRIGIMYAGELVETGAVRDVFKTPRHPYTRGLLDCLPTLDRDKRRAPLVPIPGQIGSPLERPRGCAFAPRCVHAEAGRCTVAPIPLVSVGATHEVRCVRHAELSAWASRGGTASARDGRDAERSVIEVTELRKTYRQSAGLFGADRGRIEALSGVDLEAFEGQTLAIVGESGCGKSTLARILSGLATATAGSVRLGDIEVGTQPVETRPDALKRQLQMVFQNPDSTLNPSHSVGFSVMRALRRLRRLDRSQARAEAARLFETVQLPSSFLRRKPHQLSGGQRQRVAIARALAGDPAVILADEPVSSLDVSVQAAIVNLLAELQAERRATLVFISHDLALVRYLADSVAVMYLGTIAEAGPADRVFAPPWHPYTEALLSAVPKPDPGASGARIVLEGPVPSAADLPAGCPFATRCPRKLGAICDEQRPPDRMLDDGHRIACHIPTETLLALQESGTATQRHHKEAAP
ncbi:MAG: ABC transporter ATP-binding protein [Rhodospirillales bacterium]|nr:ABC transporter ATP-binding protein [Rhodospirillales bacterium]